MIFLSACQLWENVCRKCIRNLWSGTFFKHSTKFQKILLPTPQFLFVIDVDNIYLFKLVSRTQTESWLRQKRNSDRDTFHVRRMFFYNTYFDGTEFGLKIKFCNLLEYLSVELSTCKKMRKKWFLYKKKFYSYF